MTTTTLSRRGFLVAAGAAALPIPLASADARSLNFLVIGDWGAPDRAMQRPVAAAMADVATRLRTSFVISTGDNFYDNGVASTDDPQWEQTFEQVYAAPSLQTPWYSVLGNHDHYGSPNAEIAYTRQSARWRMPARYWRQDIELPEGGQASFFFLDTTPIHHLLGLRDIIPEADLGARDQVMWLEAELAACRSPWKFVVGHHPIVSSGPHGASLGMVRHIEPLLDRYGVQAYFNGHDHDLEFLRKNGVAYICSGAGSEALPTHAVPTSRFRGEQSGFVACQLGREALQVRFINSDGATIYRCMVTRA